MRFLSISLGNFHLTVACVQILYQENCHVYQEPMNSSIYGMGRNPHADPALRFLELTQNRIKPSFLSAETIANAH